MKATRIVFAFAMLAVATTSTANAATACLDTYYRCLNDTWDTKGITRFLADLECGTQYIGCLRRQA